MPMPSLRDHAELLSLLGALGLAALGACSSTPPPADTSAQDAAEGAAPMDAPVPADVADSAPAPDASVDAPVDVGACRDFTGVWTWTGSCTATGASVDPFSCIAQTGCRTREFAGLAPLMGTVAGNVLSYDIPTPTGVAHCTYTLNGDTITLRCASTSPALTCDATGVRSAFPGATNYCCDGAAQACGAGQRCQYASNGTPTTAYTVCVPAGALAEGATCVRAGGRVGADECGAGLTCANLGQPGITQRTCQRLCTDASSCRSGEVCYALPGVVQTGICRPPCTPFGTDCVAGAGCRSAGVYQAGYVSGTPTETQAICVAAGTTADGARCSSSTDCGATSDCVGSSSTAACRPLCDPTHPCAAGSTCTELNPGSPNPRNLSFCSPN